MEMAGCFFGRTGDVIMGSDLIGEHQSGQSQNFSGFLAKHGPLIPKIKLVFYWGLASLCL
jgi:hypothetical protein